MSKFEILCVTMHQNDFSKIEKMKDKKDELKALGHLVKRNLLLYLFWVVIQLPIFVYGNHYHVDFFGKGIWQNVLHLHQHGTSRHKRL